MSTDSSKAADVSVIGLATVSPRRVAARSGPLTMIADAAISTRCGGVYRLSSPTSPVPKACDQNAASTIHAAPKISAAAKLPVNPSGRARFQTRPDRSPTANPANRYSVSSAHDAVTSVWPARA